MKKQEILQNKIYFYKIIKNIIVFLHFIIGRIFHIQNYSIFHKTTS